MRGTNSRDLVLKDVFVTEDDLMMPRGIFIKTLPHWPHVMATLSPTYMGVAQGAFDFTVAYLRGELPGQPPADRRMYATKRQAVGQMYSRLAGMRALWWQAFMEAQGFPTKGQVLRMYAAPRSWKTTSQCSRSTTWTNSTTHPPTRTPHATRSGAATPVSTTAEVA